MGQFYDEVPDDPKLIEWIKKQILFHVATAPLNGGRVNVSPKGFASFQLVNRKACWYLDLAGSGNETISHLYEPGNGRITLLFEAFEGPPRIFRIFGTGTVYERGTPEFDAFFSGKPLPNDELGWPIPELVHGARSVIWIDIAKVGTSCGYTVPKMKYEGERQVHQRVSAHLEGVDAMAEDPYTVKGLRSYTMEWNTWSVDGLPGVKVGAEKVSKERVKAVMASHGLGSSISPGVSASRRWASAKMMPFKQGLPLVTLLLGMLLGMLLATYGREGLIHASTLLRDGRPLLFELNA